MAKDPLDRKEVLRRDCPVCHSNGYITTGSGEVPCDSCAGSGMILKEVPYKFDGDRSIEEKAEAFGISVDEYRDAGHDAPRRKEGDTITNDD